MRSVLVLTPDRCTTIRPVKVLEKAKKPRGLELLEEQSHRMQTVLDMRCPYDAVGLSLRRCYLSVVPTVNEKKSTLSDSFAYLVHPTIIKKRICPMVHTFLHEARPVLLGARTHADSMEALQ